MTFQVFHDLYKPCVDIQFDYRHSQTFSKFVHDVHSENLVHVGSANKELKYFLLFNMRLKLK